jgi:hypothetical protein
MIADKTALDGASSEAIAECNCAYSLPVMRMSSLEQAAAWFPAAADTWGPGARRCGLRWDRTRACPNPIAPRLVVADEGVRKLQKKLDKIRVVC